MNLRQFYTITPRKHWTTVARSTRFNRLLAPWWDNAALKDILREVYDEARGVRAVAETMLVELEEVAQDVREDTRGLGHNEDDDIYYYRMRWPEMYEHNHRHEYYKRRRDHLDSLFTKWRASVRTRGVVSFWMRVTAETSCAPGGVNRVKDAAAFEQDFS